MSYREELRRLSTELLEQADAFSRFAQETDRRIRELDERLTVLEEALAKMLLRCLRDQLGISEEEASKLLGGLLLR